MSDTDAPHPRAFSPNAIHLVRTTQQINITLSQMADQKASILMGATFVVFTISVGQASREGLSLALSVLIIFAFLSAMLAVIAIMPAVRPRPDIAHNILFFGYFTQLSEDVYIDRVLDELADDEAIYRTMLRDVYQNGQVLQHKKYHFLGYAYRAFLVGLVLTVICLAGEKAGLIG
jgi:branched-subunit amino acid permease